jgi:hypothetical protein
MVESGQAHRGTRRAAAHVELRLLQGEITWQVAGVALETIKHGCRHRVRGYPSSREHRCRSGGDGGSDEADPFVSAGSLSHPGLAGSQGEGSTATQIHQLQLFCPQPSIRSFRRELQP